MTQAKPRYTRILVKLSGEALLGESDYGIDPAVLKRIAGELQDIVAMGVQVAVVIGGGNIFRGAGLARAGMDRVAADHMGMLATVMNSLALQDALESLGLYARVMSAIRINEVCEDYIRRRAVRHLEKGRIVMFAAGTGNPFFTTDTAAALRAIEISADMLLKATKVNGVYSDDPVRNSAARALCAPDLRQGAHRQAQRDGCDRHRHVPRQPLAFAGLQSQQSAVISPALCAARTSARRSPASDRPSREENTMLEELKKDAASPHGQVRPDLPGGAEEAADRARPSEPGRAPQGRLLRYEVPLQQVASIAVEEARTLVISPWEKSVVQAIEKAIFKSDLGLTPMTAGTVIRIPMPPLTEERRKRDHQGAAPRCRERPRRGAQRAPRRHERDQGMLKEKHVSQDDERRAETEVQKLTDRHIADIDAAARGQGEGGHAGLMSARERQSAAAHRHHHGRQRPLGRRARRGARRGPQGGTEARCACASRSARAAASRR